MLVSQILMPIILEHLCENAFRSFTIFSLSKLRYSIPPDFCPGICLNDHMGFPLLIFVALQIFKFPIHQRSSFLAKCHMGTV